MNQLAVKKERSGLKRKATSDPSIDFDVSTLLDASYCVIASKIDSKNLFRSFGFMGAVIAEKNVLAASQASGLLKALADPLRMEVIQSLSEGERCVCDLM